jgi:hypothetical protein
MSLTSLSKCCLDHVSIENQVTIILDMHSVLHLHYKVQIEQKVEVPTFLDQRIA